MQPRLALFLCVCILTSGSLSKAGYFEEIGYTRLEAELGLLLIPDGSGVKVTQVESSQPKDGLFFLPNEEIFPDKQFTHSTPGGSLSEGQHATIVGRRLYGSPLSIASGISEIETFLSIEQNSPDTNDWLGTGFLQLGSGRDKPGPSVHQSRIANHSYITDFERPADMMAMLERIDWVIATDDYIQVVGTNNGSITFSGLAGSYNAISVGRLDGNHAIGSLELGEEIYNSGRTRPDIVDDEGATSFSTPRVAASAALLIQLAHENPSLSHGLKTNRAGQDIYHAETSEVIRSALMAGADRTAVNRFPNGDHYIIDTSNGLNQRYGAGQNNIFNSYNIIAAGEQNRLEEGGPDSIDQYGFDYVPTFSNTDRANYFFSLTEEQGFSSSLVWNLDVNIDKLLSARRQTELFEQPIELSAVEDAAILYNLDLNLYRRTNTGDMLIESSASLNENTENLYLPKLSAGDYRLEVMPAVGETISTDFALAWRRLPIGLRGNGKTHIQNFNSLGLDDDADLPSGWKSISNNGLSLSTSNFGLSNLLELPEGAVNVGGNSSRFSTSDNLKIATWQADLNGDNKFDADDILEDAAFDRALGISRQHADETGKLTFELAISESPLRALAFQWDLEVWGGSPDSQFRGEEGAGFQTELFVAGKKYYSSKESLIPGQFFNTESDGDSQNIKNSTLINGNAHSLRNIFSGVIEVVNDDGEIGNLIDIVFDADHGGEDAGWISAIDNLTIRSLAAGDTDGDGDIDPLDIIAVQAAGKFGKSQVNATWEEGDFDQNGQVDPFDIIQIQISLAGVFPKNFAHNQQSSINNVPNVIINPHTGSITIDTQGKELSNLIIESLSGIFDGIENPDWNLPGPFYSDEDERISLPARFNAPFFSGRLELGENILGKVPTEFDISSDITISYLEAGSRQLQIGKVTIAPEPSTAEILLLSCLIIFCCKFPNHCKTRI